MFKQLLLSAGTDTASLSKVSMLIGITVCSLIVLWQTWHGTLSSDLFAWYISVTVGANTANKAISVVGNKPPITKPDDSLGEPQ